MSSKKQIIDSIKEQEERDTFRDVSRYRSVLGKFTLRDMMEAVYGTAYTNMILAETEGDVLMEDVIMEVDTKGKRAQVVTRVETGHVKGRTLTPSEQREADRLLEDQMLEAEAAAIRSAADGQRHILGRKEDREPYRPQNNQNNELLDALDGLTAEEISALLTLAKKLKG